MFSEKEVRAAAQAIEDENGCIRCIACNCEDPCENKGFAELFVSRLRGENSA